MGARARSALAALVAVALVVATIVAITSGGNSKGAGSASSQTFTTATSSGFDGAALPPGRRASDFSLTDQSGGRISLGELRGQVRVLAFLYSSCGAPCFLIAQQIRGALDELGRAVPVLIVSADPRADDPVSVRRFLAQVSLTGRVRYLTGSLSQLKRIWRAYKVVPASAGPTAFARYASVLLIDHRGDERVLFQTEQLTPESLAHDIGKLDGEPTHPDTLAAR